MSASDVEMELIPEAAQVDSASISGRGAKRMRTIMLGVCLGVIVLAGLAARAWTQHKETAKFAKISADDTVSSLYNPASPTSPNNLANPTNPINIHNSATNTHQNHVNWHNQQAYNTRLRNEYGGGGFEGECFAGEVTLNVRGKGITPLTNISVGDCVLVRKSKALFDYEPVLGFLHAAGIGAPSNFLSVIHAEGKLHVSANHLVFLADGSDKLAAQLVVGDELAVPRGNGEVLAIETSTGNSGMYAPLTAAGTVVVDGVVASNYATHSSATWIPHSAIHSAFFAVRLYHAMGFGGQARQSKPTVDAIHPFADFLHTHVSGFAFKLLQIK